MTHRSRRILVTGGCGFIGSAVVRHLIRRTPHRVVNVDALTYAASSEAVKEVADSERYAFVQADICDRHAIRRVLQDFQPDWVMHLAAETHVDRSIDDPEPFLRTNVEGTFVLLEEARRYWAGLSGEKRARFRFHHISTDEVFGDLDWDDPPFTEESPYRPSSPYAASKAASDHLVRAWHRTYGLPVLLTNCSNNYGPYQFPEKLIPHMILRALRGEELPVYGDGRNVRDWLYVEEHAEALVLVLEKGKVGESYNVGARAERTNLEVVRAICTALEELKPEKPRGVGRYEELIRFVEDRPGHDRRYAIDPAKLERELGWRAKVKFEEGIRRTVQWYLQNEWWWRPLVARSDALRRKGVAA